jgi:DNA polymerase-1
MQNVVLDVETDGLLEEATCIHSLVIRNIDTDEVLSCIGKPTEGPNKYWMQLGAGLEALKKAERIYGHNLIKFDRPVLKKLLGYEIPWEKCLDTLVVSAFRWAHIKEMDYENIRKGVYQLPSTTNAKGKKMSLVGSHSLEAWGHRLNVLKGEYKKTHNFSKWTPELQAYCEQDTAVTRALVLHLRKSGATPALAIEIEQELAVYLDEQEQAGWPFNADEAVQLQGRLSKRREELMLELRAQFGTWQKSKGFFTPKRDDKKRGYKAGVPVEKFETIEFNPGSRQHIANRLQVLYGWQPPTFTPSGQPEVNEETLESLPQDIPGVKLLTEYLLVEKRLGQLAEGEQAWLKQMTKDRPKGGKMTGMFHIHGGVKQNGTVTHRGAHVNPNLGQVPAVHNPYGPECRGLFTVPEGWVEVGSDASGLELRELSHYMGRFDGGAYGKTVVEGKNEDGTDIHSVNRGALGLEGKAGRDGAKRFIYTFLYGGGDYKIGTVVPPTEAELAAYKADGKRWKKAVERLKKSQLPTDDRSVGCLIKGGLLKARFLKNLPALGALVETVKAKAKECGFLLLHDGRRVYIRYAHAALNSLLQGGGAIVCKRWIVRVARRLRAEFGPPGWDGKWVPLGWIHDETQLAVRPEIVERVRQIQVEEIRAVGLEFNLRVPLDGESKAGQNWAECH